MPDQATACSRSVAQDVVIDDHPSWLRLRFPVEAENLDPGILVDKQDLTPPVQLQRGGADDEDRPVRRRALHRDDRLARLAETHVVAEERPLF